MIAMKNNNCVACAASAPNTGASANTTICGSTMSANATAVAYDDALRFIDQRTAEIREGSARECIWLLEHPPLFTAGTSADPSELFNAQRFPVYDAGRGGRYTYHGPGQRVGYVMLDL